MTQAEIGDEFAFQNGMKRYYIPASERSVVPIVSGESPQTKTFWIECLKLTYVWRKMGEDRWLCIAVGKPRVVVGEVIRVGIRRFRIQLRLRTGETVSPKILFEHLKIAQRVLTSKLNSTTKNCPI